MHENAMTIPRHDPAPTRPHQVLVVIRGHGSPTALADYAVGVAERLGLGIVAAYVDTLPRFGDRRARRERFATAVAGDAAVFAAKAKNRDLAFEHVTASGKASQTVLAIVHGGRRIDFVVLDPTIGLEEVAGWSPVPVFGLDVAGGDGEYGRGHQRRQLQNPWRVSMSERTRKRNVIRSVVFGTAAAALYAAVFTHADAISALAAKGGMYAIVPVVTVFLFSYIHGSFTGAFWSALGIEASKGATQKQATVAAERRKDTRATAQVNAS